MSGSRAVSGARVWCGTAVAAVVRRTHLAAVNRAAGAAADLVEVSEALRRALKLRERQLCGAGRLRDIIVVNKWIDRKANSS